MFSGGPKRNIGKKRVKKYWNFLTVLVSFNPLHVNVPFLFPFLFQRVWAWNIALNWVNTHFPWKRIYQFWGIITYQQRKALKILHCKFISFINNLSVKLFYKQRQQWLFKSGLIFTKLPNFSCEYLGKKRCLMVNMSGYDLETEIIYS